jgi:hypothetical protein
LFRSSCPEAIKIRFRFPEQALNCGIHDLNHYIVVLKGEFNSSAVDSSNRPSIGGSISTANKQANLNEF